MKNRSKIIFTLFILYISSYLVIRSTNVETWQKDGKEYVIFPKEKVWMYYLYRPLSYIDSKLTDMRFHIGKHE
jgi:hypothetical protein